MLSIYMQLGVFAFFLLDYKGFLVDFIFFNIENFDMVKKSLYNEANSKMFHFFPCSLLFILTNFL